MGTGRPVGRMNWATGCVAIEIIIKSATMASKGKGGKGGKGGKAGADELTAQDEKEMYAAKVWTLQGRLGTLL